ncbi:MAG: hypothetical protein LBM08_02680 [Dysgonamonadaceae bacterium]|jgi:hypothetical protein|nr:hypothetical protein [Dysgonamonadaceae bacterium]
MENNINQLIAKVLNRVASSEEIVSFSRWLSGEESSRDEFCRLKSYWDAEISFRHTLNPELSLQKTQQKIQLEQQGRKKKKRILYRL